MSQKFLRGGPHRRFGGNEILGKHMILEALKLAPQARFWSRGFRGSNVADFWVRPSHRSILLDLLLVEISEVRGPP